MSKIRVMTPVFKWSNGVYGLDKVRFLKDSIIAEYNSGDCEESWYKDMPIKYLKELEIDNKSFTYDEDEVYYDGYGHIDWDKFISITGIAFPKVKTLRMRLSTLEKLSKGKDAYCGIYKELISAANVPASHPTGCCLLFRFEDE